MPICWGSSRDTLHFGASLTTSEASAGCCTIRTTEVALYGLVQHYWIPGPGTAWVGWLWFPSEISPFPHLLSSAPFCSVAFLFQSFPF